MFTTKSWRQTITTQAWASGTMWALLRIFVGWQFLQAGLQKIGSPVWTGTHAGLAVRGFLGHAASPQMTGGPHPNVLRPYAWLDTHVLLDHTALLSYLVTGGELLVGVALILGLGTRVAALGGAFLNSIYLLSGSAGLNVPMLPIELSIVLVGTTAGLIGLDSVVLPYLQQRLVRSRRLRQQGRQGHMAPAGA